MTKYLEINHNDLTSNDNLLIALEDLTFKSSFVTEPKVQAFLNKVGCDSLEKYISYYSPRFEFCYVNIFSSVPEIAVISILSQDGTPIYLLMQFDKAQGFYNVVFNHSDFSKFDTSELDSQKIDDAFAKRVISKIHHRRIEIEFPYNYVSSYNSYNKVFTFKNNDESYSFTTKLLFDFVDGSEKHDNMEIVDSVLAIDSTPAIKEINVKHNNAFYSISCSDEADVIENEEDEDKIYESNVILDGITEVAREDFNKKYTSLIEKVESDKAIEALTNYLLSAKDAKYFIEDNLIYIIGSESVSFGEIFEKEVVFNTSRDPRENKEEIIPINSNIVSNVKAKIGDCRKKFLHSRSPQVSKYFEEARMFLDGNLSFEDLKVLGEKLLNEKYNDVDSSEREKNEFKNLVREIKDKLEGFSKINKRNVSKVLGIINDIDSEEKFYEHAEELYDAIDDLTDAERLSIQDKINQFKSAFDILNDYSPYLKEVRRVYISRSVYKEIKKIDDINREIHLLNTLNKVVTQLKTLPGDQLGGYLLEKGLNFPIKADRSIKKIRIIRKQPYRLMFLYGSDFLGKNSDNADSIYIFDLSQHKKDGGDLYQAVNTKPTKYEINRFIIYPVNDRNIKIPECSKEQFVLSRSHEDKPVITFGCAGSGKTTVSIEQYVDIVWEKYHAVSPTPDKLVYITYHPGLCKNARKYIAEYCITGNCYVLYDYFARILGIEIDSSKILIESVFVHWYEDIFLKNPRKYKKTGSLSALKDKPDAARLVYTYYRGVFRGSKELYNLNKPHLDYPTFKKEMSDETYLNEDEKKTIFEICELFYEYTQKNGIVGDNELAIEIIRSINAIPKERFSECIIIDEVQDLTEIELIAIVATLNRESNKIYFYGDPHQSINPNLFDSGTLNKVYTTLGRTEKVAESKPLTYTYRTNKNLISYLKELETYRDKWIGSTKGSVLTQGALCEEDSDTAWAGYVTDKELYPRILTITSSNCMIITPSDKVKESLLNRYPDVDPSRVITIYEAKGMEWDNVILYNVFTDYNSYFTDMISMNGKARKSTIHRMTFNKYYVACTRSLKSFVIVEENQEIYNEDNVIFDGLLKGFSPITSGESVSTFIEEDNSFDGWYREAIQNLDNDNAAGFKHALEHARKLAVTDEQKDLIASIASDDINILSEIAIKYLDEGKYESASHIFAKCCKKEHDKYINYRRICTLLSGNPQNYNVKTMELVKDEELMKKYPQVLPFIVKSADFKRKFKYTQNKLASMMPKKGE